MSTKKNDNEAALLKDLNEAREELASVRRELNQRFKELEESHAEDRKAWMTIHNSSGEEIEKLQRELLKFRKLVAAMMPFVEVEVL